MTRARAMKLDYADMTAAFGKQFGVTAFTEVVKLSHQYPQFALTEIMGVCLIAGQTTSVHSICKYASERYYTNLWDLPPAVISKPPVDTPAPAITTPLPAMTKQELALFIVGELQHQNTTSREYSVFVEGDNMDRIAVDGVVNMSALAERILEALGK